MFEIIGTPLTAFIFMLLCYFVGGIPFGLLVGRIKGVDLRLEGSKNIGATNAYRVLGKGWGITVFLLDFLKGYTPLAFASYLFIEGGMVPKDLFLVLGGVGAVVGHNFSIFLKFKGGKGMATSAGVLLAWVPISLLVCISLWIIITAVTRYVSLASIAASIVLPISTIIAYQGQWSFMGASLILGAMSVWRHRVNIQRLRDGTEHRFGQKKKEPTKSTDLSESERERVNE
ncbi:MAG: glycerol-3-phosphate 1-O-acyltransferase PlsY [Verrucomicrobiota bacterium]